jgi:hypothetical protein
MVKLVLAFLSHLLRHAPVVRLFSRVCSNQLIQKKLADMLTEISLGLTTVIHVRSDSPFDSNSLLAV